MLQVASHASRVVVFRQFSRKNNAVFLSLKREIRIGVLSVSALTFASVESLSASPLSGFCSNDTLREYALGEAAVLGTRTPLAPQEAMRLVTVIPRSEIERVAAQSVADLLKQTAGVDVRQRGGFGVQTDIGVGGGTFDQITILLNGVPVNNPQTGHLSFDIPILPDDVERIEVLSGAASSALGSQAFCGAINIVSRKKNVSPLYARMEAGSFGSVSLGIGSGLSNEHWSHQLSLAGLRSDGGTDNSDFRQAKAFLRGDYHDASLKIEWQLGASVKDYGANTFYSAAWPDQWEANRRYLASVRGETAGTWHFSPLLSWLRTQDHYQLSRGSRKNENFHRTDVWTFGLSAWRSWLLGRTSLGGEMRQEDVLSTSLGRPVKDGAEVPVHSQKGVCYDHRDQRTNVSLFAEHYFNIGLFSASLGLLANRNSALDEQLHFYPGVDVRCRLSRKFSFFASWNKAMRLPTFTDLYYKSPTQEGNVGLRPEETTTCKTGLKISDRGFDASLSAHYARGRNMIDWVMRHEEDIYHSANFRLDNYGFSLDFCVKPQTFWGERFPIDNFRCSYACVHQKRHEKEKVYKSNYALEYLRHKFTANLDHRIFGPLSVSWQFRWQERAGAYILYRHGQTRGEKRPYAPYALLDAKLCWQGAHYQLSLSVQDLLSHRYYDLGNIPQPGAWWMAGIKWQI